MPGAGGGGFAGGLCGNHGAMPGGSQARDRSAGGHEGEDHPEGDVLGNQAAEEESDAEDYSEDEELSAAFQRTVRQGLHRLDRSWPDLLATGMVGGFDVGAGVLALLLVQQHTGDPLLGALAFSIGFVVLLLSGSELFTENFLVPVTAVVARPEKGIRSVARLWSATFAANLVGGWVITALIVAGLPHLRSTAVEVGHHYPAMGIGGVAFAASLLGGMVMTLLTWLEQRAPSVGGRVAAAVSMGFLIAAGPLNHAVVSALEMSAALVAGAPFGYLDAFGVVGWTALGNVVGGIGLVTVLRLVQVGRVSVAAAQHEAQGSSPNT